MLVDSTVKDFLAKVAGSDPVPGGGSIAALNGAIAAALAAMVAGLTVGKKGYEENEEQMQRIQTLAIRQKEEFLIDVDRDSEAYNKVFDCFRMPKSTEDEKSARSAAIQEATRFAALVPMQVARNAYELMVIIADVARLGNRNAVTDACVAMMSARSAVLGALMNVRINLGTLKIKHLSQNSSPKPMNWNVRPVKRERITGYSQSGFKSMNNVYYVGSGELTFDIIERIINENLKLELAPEAKLRIQKCRDYLDQKIAASNTPLYGITTGFGSLCNKTSLLMSWVLFRRTL